MPSAKPKAVQRLDHYLRQELGNDPLYSWQWSEDLLHVMFVFDSSGQVVYDYVPRLVRGTTDQLMVHPVPRKTTRKLFPQLVNQWVMCGLVPINDDDASQFGFNVASWMPVTDRHSIPVAVVPGELPTMADTLEFCRLIRERREHGDEAMRRWEEDNLRLVPLHDGPDAETVTPAERKQYDRLHERIANAMPAYGNIPGKKLSAAFQVGGSRDSDSNASSSD